ncbi:helix-hairpin-helix domain-containing protein [Daejeonella sp. H1SJ63]|uniref:helix-hairpin-helix domain-containing protein n=1 Tax=Daejeonella sp. H1SJ63 TaxID=3034145 RepID=UPI0023EBFFF8|nr:helix-hairpin-helix domain-containing protein [Daejeonella sp. H1SJ63]
MNFKHHTGILIFLLLLLNVNRTNAQVPAEELFIQLIESFNPDIQDAYDQTELLEQWNHYRKHPLNLNTADSDELRQLFFLSEIQINAILKHRKENGLFLDILELQAIRELDIPAIRLIGFFSMIREPYNLSVSNAAELFQRSEQELILRFGMNSDQLNAAGQSESEYSGSSLRMLVRYRYNYQNKLYASLNMEKDAGEQFFNGRKPGGFDFYSGNIFLKNAGVFKKFLIGDYSLQFGQGLAMWTGSGFGKGVVLNTVARQDHGLKPYSSVNEVLFLRGLAGSIAFNKILFTPFMSFRKYDASISDSGTEINSLVLTGLHRTSAELANQNRLNSFIIGANVGLSQKHFHLGLTAYRTKFNLPFGKGKYLYDQYSFTGNHLINSSLYYSYTFRNTYFFGELANSYSSGTALINGMMSSLSSGVSLLLLQRNYSRNYHSFFNQALSESSEAVNERGFLAGLELKFNPGWEFFSYTDLFRFPWLKFRVDGPSKGYENLFRLTYKPNKKFKLLAQVKQQLKQENPDLFLNSAGLENVYRYNYRLELSYRINDKFTLRNRAEFVKYHKIPYNPEYGFLNYQDIIYDPMSSRFSANLRFGIFDTEGFNSRIYAYENDVLYSYSVPAYQGSGLRFYVNARYTLLRGIDVWLRYAHRSLHDNKFKVSENDSEKQSDLRIQLRYQF